MMDERNMTENDCDTEELIYCPACSSVAIVEPGVPGDMHYHCDGCGFSWEESV